MKISNTIEEDLNHIRLAIYEETKNMTWKQRREHMNRKTEASLKQMGWELVPNHDSLNSMRLVRIHETPEKPVPVAK